MKNKKIFFEWRFLYRDTPPEGGGAAGGQNPESGKETMNKAVEAIGKKKFVALAAELDKVFPFRGGKKPESIFENNPFFDKGKEKFLTFMSELPDAYEPLKKASFVNGSMVIEDSKYRKVTLDSETCKIIFWQEIENDLKGILVKAGAKDIDEKTIRFAAFRSAKVGRLVDQIVKNLDEVKVDDALVKEIIDEMKSRKFREDLAMGAKTGRIIAQTGVEIAQVDSEIKRNTLNDLNNAFGVAPTQSEIDKQRIDEWLATVAREGKKINAHKWQPETKNGLDEMRSEWILVGIPAEPGNPFYDKIFNQLSKSSNTAFLSTISDPNINALYIDPRNHLNELQAQDNGFYRSWKFFESVKNFLVQQDTYQVDTPDKIKDLDRDKYAAKITDGVKQNLVKFQEAVRDRDYVTAGMYIAGIWAIYKSYKKLSDGPNGDKAIKWLTYGAAVYAGNIFLKNSGIDIMKKLGMKDAEAEVMGTPLESLGRLKIPQAKDIDYAVYLRTSEMKLASLHEKYEISNGKGVRFIDPALFPDEFPQFKNKIPSDQEKDHEYRRVGEQLYLVIHCLELGYDKTLKVDQGMEKYYQKDFKDVIYNDPVLKDSNVRQLTGILIRYAPAKYEKSLFEPEAIKKARERFQEVFAKTDMGAHLDLAPLDKEKHIVGGEIMKMPIVVVTDPTAKRYKIYSKKDYNDKKGSIHSSKELGSIPFAGDATSDLADLRSNITQHVINLVNPISSTGGRVIVPPKYDRGKWIGKIQVPGAAKYDIAAHDGNIEIMPREDGGISIHIDGSPVDLNVDYLMDQGFPVAGVLLANMVSSDDMAALRGIYGSGKLRFSKELGNDSSGNPKFEITACGEKIPVTYDKTAKKFSIELADQEKLLQNSLFRREYSESLANSPNIKELFDKLGDLVKDAPEEFHLYFFSGLKGWVTGATLDSPFRGVNLDVISGSLPDYYTHSVLEAKKLSLMYALEGRLANSKNFAEAWSAETEVWTDAIAELKALSNTLLQTSTDLEVKGDKWKQDNFITSIVRPLQRAGLKSRTYGSSLDDFEVKSMAKFGLKGSDIFKDAHRSLAHLKGVYAFYTGHLDDESLDKIKYPVPASADPKNDPVLDPYYRIGYFTYVRDEILRQAKGFGDVLPNPEAWKISDYKSWKESAKAVVTPLDPEDAKAPMEHNPAARTIDPVTGRQKPTELEAYYVKELKTLASDLKTNGKDKIQAARLDEYVKDYLVGGDLTGDCNLINGLYGARRSMQIVEVKRYIDIHKQYILQNDDFWIDLSVWERFKLLFR